MPKSSSNRGPLGGDAFVTISYARVGGISVKGNGKKAAGFWREVAERFHEEMGEDKRSYDSVNCKWKNRIRPKSLNEVLHQLAEDGLKKKGSSSGACSETSIAGDPSLVDALLSKFTMAATPFFTQRKESSSEYLRIKEPVEFGTGKERKRPSEARRIGEIEDCTTDKYGCLAQIIAHKEPFPDLSTVHSMVFTEEMRIRNKSPSLSVSTNSSAPQVLLTETPHRVQDTRTNKERDNRTYMIRLVPQHNADGSLNRYKARLVANGSTQIVGIDVDETFSPVVKPATIRTVLSLAISRHWLSFISSMSRILFAMGSLSETVYMHQPPGFRDPRHPDHVCLLQRSLYGLKQAPRAWFQRFAAYAARVGFLHSRCDSSLFIYRQGSDTAYLLLYVDDIVLTASLNFASAHHCFPSCVYFLGMTWCPLLLSVVFRDFVILSGMFLFQQSMPQRYLKRDGMLTCKPYRTPVDTDSKLAAAGDPVSDPTLYRRLAGALQYINFWFTALLNIRILFSCFSDAIGLDVPLHGALIWLLWFLLATIFYLGLPNDSLLFSILVREAEYRGVANASGRIAVYLSSNPVQHQRTKHIEIDIHFVRDLVTTGHIRVLHVPSRYQYADIFTKGLPTALFDEFRDSLSVRSSPAQTAGGC
ncbi:ribonuclease H-like domain-containing protein [Tanacetum coccineum]